ncbi:glycosyltransferase family 2 protein [Microvirga pudoricolor]|uniref:glycosyltransferase family 2 protein n=1 Tax=Microvirga pudoricolor TaxID=2778729 RepID=UPI001951275B|nr:glycosyltransferase family 2 protein [Microvirga pudoricolor]MBM6596243.1 glycosyltransferase family 2 protein [Microvirga pudoricolor]
MQRIDVSVVLSLHREGKFLARTLSSLAVAADYARRRGKAVELVAVFDRTDAVTREIFEAADLTAFSAVRQTNIMAGSLSLSRNAGIAEATGEYIETADGDDLVSYSFIDRMCEEAAKLGDGAILVPKYIFGFGYRYRLGEYFNQDQIHPEAMLKHHLYSSKIVAHRSLFEKLRFTHVPASSGYAYEDWHFNCEAMALGYRFHAVEGTVLFYRQRVESLSYVSDRTSVRQPMPSTLFEPSTFQRVFADNLGELREGMNLATQTQIVGPKVFRDPAYEDLVAAANQIDPSIHIEAFRQELSDHYWNIVDPRIGRAYHSLCEQVGNRPFDHVILLPSWSFRTTSDPMVSLSSDLAADTTKHVLVVLDGADGGPAPDGIAGATILDLDALASDLPPGDRDLLCFKLIQGAAPGAHLHMTSSPLAERLLNRFGPLWQSYEVTYYRYPDVVSCEDAGGMTEPQGFNALSDHIDIFRSVVAFDRNTAESDQARLGYQLGKWRIEPFEPIHPPPARYQPQALPATEPGATVPEQASAEGRERMILDLQSEVETLRLQAEQWETMKASRAYRAAELYRALYRMPGIGRGLEAVRRLVGASVRWIRAR